MISKGLGRPGIRSLLALSCLAGLLAASKGFFDRGENGQQLQPCKPQKQERHPGPQIPPPLVKFLLQNGFCTLYIPELNDVQRLWDKDLGYGPVTWGFARPGLDAYTSHEPFDNQLTLVVIVGVGTGSLPKPYQTLTLGNGIYCVFLQHLHPAASDPRWDALVVQQEAGTCVPNEATGHHLRVAVDQPALTDPNPPPVTRFIEHVNYDALIGVRCGRTWCNIGTDDPAKINPPTHGVVSSAQPTQWRIKGWFDDQSLGIATGVSEATPLGIFPAYHASLVPHPKLDGYTIASFKSGWRHVATLFWPPSSSVPPKYLNGYGLAPGNNEIWIAFKNNVWKARIINSSHPAGLVRNVLRTAHPGFAVPATARWVWSDTDEEIWVKCDVGCCLVQGGFQ